MESYTLPFMLKYGNAADEKREKAEVLSKAFSDAAGAYFHRYNDIEKVIKSVKNKMYAFLTLGLLLCISSVIVLFILDNLTIGLVLLITGIISLGISYFYKSKKAKKHDEKENLYPDETMKYLSKMYLPVYIVPYSERKSMVIDSRDLGEPVEVELENYDTDRLFSSFEDFNKAVKNYAQIRKGGELIDVEYLEEYNGSIKQEKILEKDLLDSLENINEYSHPNSWNQKIFRVNVHRPESDFNIGLNRLYGKKEMVNRPIQSFEVYTSPEEAIEGVEDLKGLEMEASSSDILDQTVRWKQSISDYIKTIESSLEDNIEEASFNYEMIRARSFDLVDRQICPKCLSMVESEDTGPTKGEPVKTYYDLEEFVLNNLETPIRNMDSSIRCEDCHSVIEAVGKKTVDCPTCNSETIEIESPEGSPKRKAEKYIKTNINVKLDDIPMEYVFGLSTCYYKDGEWYCEKHGYVEPKILPGYGDVLSIACDGAWEEMKKPVRKQVAKTKDNAVDCLDQYRSQKLQLSSYTQLENEVECVLSQLEGDMMAARMALSNLGWKVENIQRDSTCAPSSSNQNHRQKEHVDDSVQTGVNLYD